MFLHVLGTALDPYFVPVVLERERETAKQKPTKGNNTLLRTKMTAATGQQYIMRRERHTQKNGGTVLLLDDNPKYIYIYIYIDEISKECVCPKYVSYFVKVSFLVHSFFCRWNNIYIYIYFFSHRMIMNVVVVYVCCRGCVCKALSSCWTKSSLVE